MISQPLSKHTCNRRDVSHGLLILALIPILMSSGAFFAASTTGSSLSTAAARSNTQSATISEATPSLHDCVLANLSIGTPSLSLAYDGSNGNVYVADGNAVSEINASSPTVLSVVYSGGGPQVLTEDSANNFVYAANVLSDSISVIDGENNSVVRVLPLPNLQPVALDFVPQTSTLYISGSVPPQNVVGRVIAISPTTGKITGQATVGNTPAGLAFDPSNGYLYVSNAGSGNITVVNATTMHPIDSIIVQGEPVGEALDSQRGTLYVSDISSGNISVINVTSSSVVATIRYASGFTGNSGELALDSVSGQLFVASDRLQVVDVSTNTLGGNLSLGTGLNALAIDVKDSILFAGTESGGRLYEISTSGVCPTQKTPSQPPLWEQVPFLLTVIIFVSLLLLLSLWYRHRNRRADGNPSVTNAAGKQRNP